MNKRNSGKEKRKRNKGFPYKNKKGQVKFLLFLMIGITVIILALAFAPGIKQSVELAMNPSNMDCANVSISDFDKTACIGTDLLTPAYIGGLIFIAISIISGAIFVKLRRKQ